MQKPLNYEVGDTVIYSPFGGGRRTVVVEEKDPDIKNGRPGFAGGEVWGYDYQIITVIPKAREE